MRSNSATVLSIDGDKGPPGTFSHEPGSLRATVSESINKGEFHQSQIARETGLSAAAVSTWLKGTYKGDNIAVEDKISIWLSAREEKKTSISGLPLLPSWIATPTAGRITNVLLYAQMAGDIAVVYGGAGVGKTYSCIEYQRKYPNVWLVTMTSDTANVAAALEEIAETIGLRGTPGRASRLRRELSRKFKGTGGLLIIDEAQHLSIAALESLRAIYDATGIGLVLAGNEFVYARLTGGNRAATFAQLFSRLGKKLRLVRPSKNDASALLDAIQVFGKQERQALMEIALKDGALRLMVKVWRLATMLAAGKETPVTCEHIRLAWQDLGGS